MMWEEKANITEEIITSKTVSFDSSKLYVECYADKIILRNTEALDVEDAYLYIPNEQVNLVLPADNIKNSVEIISRDTPLNLKKGDQIEITLYDNKQRISLGTLTCWA